jgi:isoleucyl-tRNA synthetase
LEYPENHVSKSIYVGFDIAHPSTKLAELLASSSGKGRILIWTTTPWSIPANLAIAVNGAIEYAIVSHPNVMRGEKLIVARDLVKTLSGKFGLNVKEGEMLTVEASITGDELTDTSYKHPLYDRISNVVIGGDYITTESGTGLVHTAPGHGQDDYLTGLKYGLPLLSPVNDLGCFTEEAGERLQGQNVLGDGNLAVIQMLTETNALVLEEAYNHKYPYDWRTKKPTIVRATEQWFASVSTFRDDAMKAIDSVQWIPSVGRNRIASMTESRGDW